MTACAATSHPPSPAPTPAPSPTLSPAPTDVTADLARAGGLYYEGEFEQALRLYSDTARAAAGSQRIDALWELARAAYGRGNAAAAESALEDLIAARPDAERERLALLLLGTVRLDRGDDMGAEEALTEYLDTDGAAIAYASVRLADIAARRGDTTGAIAYANAALEGGMSASAEAETRFALAGYLEDGGDASAAADEYRRVIATAAGASDRAEALWLLAGLVYRMGDNSASATALRTLIHEYPWHSRALEALEQPQLIASPPPVRDRALVLFRHRLNADAEQAFRDVLTDPAAGDPAEAHYYLGILAERAGDPNEALAEYNSAIADLQDGHDPALLGQSLWDRATVIEMIGTAADAAAAYTAVAHRAPGSEHAPEALFHAGLIEYREGLPAEAASLWTRYLGAAGDPESPARAHFWLEKTELNPFVHGLHADAAATAAPLDYYGLRARAGAPATEFPTPSAVTPVETDWSRVEEWLTGWAGPEDTADRSAFFEDAPWLRTAELQRAGLEDEARVELEELLERATPHPWLLYRFARAVSDEGAVAVAARAGERLSKAHEDAPPDVLLLAYPPEYLDLANEYALENGFSPLLLLALVRQESVYDPDAFSFAGASGLTQVIPSTAAQIASELGERAFTDADLLRPRVSLRFGAYYLGQQLEGFGGDLPAALAAYNGGPGNAARWSDASGGDPDLFLESIDFSETRAYVELVLENYALYLYAFGLMEKPSLPLP